MSSNLEAIAKKVAHDFIVRQCGKHNVSGIETKDVYARTDNGQLHYLVDVAYYSELYGRADDTVDVVRHDGEYTAGWWK